MNKTLLLFALFTVAIMSCTKTTNNTNNYGSGQPPFIIDGISNLTFTNNTVTEGELPLTVVYTDSAQQIVTLSLSPLPSGIAIDTAWLNSGYPNFSTTLLFYDTTAAGATPGVYPVTLTATTATSQRTYKFNITVKAQPQCTTNILGKDTLCTTHYSGAGPYTDSIWADATIVNKIWFKNFANSGQTVYGNYNCANGTINIPLQTVSGITFAGSGEMISFISGSASYAYGVEIEVSLPVVCQFTDANF